MSPDGQVGAELEAAWPPLEDSEEVDKEAGEDGAPGVWEDQLRGQQPEKWLGGLDTNWVCEYFSEDGC